VPCGSSFRRDLPLAVAPGTISIVIRVPPTPAPTTRSATLVMRANRRRDTAPERRVRSALHAVGLRFRVDLALRVEHWARVIRPDVVFTSAKVAVFVDGCYWHGCPEHYEAAKSNVDYWGPKIARNRERDEAQTVALQSDGWLVVRVWEHEDPAAAAAAISVAVRSRAGARRRTPQ